MTESPNGPLRNLEREVAPPTALKGRVLSTLRARGMLRPRGALVLRLGGALAAGLALFLAGRMTVAAGGAGEPADARPRYALLLYEGPEFDRQVPDDSYIAEYAAWASGLRRRGAFVDGNPLAPSAQLLAPAGTDVRVESRDVTSEAGTMAGYFIVRAADEAEALAIARSCPHLRHGGRIAVRPVIPT